ncbi:MAG: hypothetical protein P1V20_04360 [Verrucomicrobiales bacterium]|nr:hypothetical protein [Verrucomicrobiales bacterium]
MSHEKADAVYDAAHAAQQKFEYFLTGSIGAMFAYTAQTYNPEKLGVNPSTIEAAAIITFAVAFFLGICRISAIYISLAISYEQLHARADAKAIREGLKTVDSVAESLSPQQKENRDQLRQLLASKESRSQSAQALRDEAHRKGLLYHNSRNYLLMLGFGLLICSKLWTPYFDSRQMPQEHKLEQSKPSQASLPGDQRAPAETTDKSQLKPKEAELPVKQPSAPTAKEPSE